LQGHPEIAQSGSVRDVFTPSSYGKLDVISKVFDWIILPQTESYYADSKSGDSDIFLESILYGLSLMEGNEDFSFTSFDNNNDGYLDAVTILHSRTEPNGEAQTTMVSTSEIEFGVISSIFHCEANGKTLMIC